MPEYEAEGREDGVYFAAGSGGFGGGKVGLAEVGVALCASSPAVEMSAPELEGVLGRWIRSELVQFAAVGIPRYFPCSDLVGAENKVIICFIYMG